METEAKITDLIQAGLTKDQATIYISLLTRGRSAASKLVPLTTLSRPMVYRILDELVTLGLVTKHDAPKMVSQFESAHPLKLREFIDAKRSEVETKHKALESVLGSLISDYTALSGKPGVRILQGLAGISELYEDILNENVDIQLIRSPYDDRFPELLAVVLEQIKNQVKVGIHTQAITPFDNETTEELETDDSRNLVERRLASLETLDLPAQIILYADKVAITAFDTELMTTIIQNPAISKTFQMLFGFMWTQLESEDTRIRTGLRNGTLTPPRPR